LKPRILVVDDEASIRDTLRMILEYEGYDVLQAATGEDGVRLIEREAPDVVFLDIKMPGMDGIEVLQKIRHLTDSTPVIVISGHVEQGGASSSEAAEAIKLGARDFIEKPPTQDRILVTVRNALDTSRLRSENRSFKKDIEKRRASSAARGDFSPWKSHYLAMARKTVLTALIQGGTVPTAEEMVTFASVEQHLEEGGSMADRAALGLPEDLGGGPAPVGGAPESASVVDAVVTETPTPEDRSKFAAASPEDAKAAWMQACIESELNPEDAADLVRNLGKDSKLAKFDPRTAGNGEILAAAKLLAQHTR